MFRRHLRARLGDKARKFPGAHRLYRSSDTMRSSCAWKGRRIRTGLRPATRPGEPKALLHGCTVGASHTRLSRRWVRVLRQTPACRACAGKRRPAPGKADEYGDGPQSQLHPVDHREVHANRCSLVAIAFDIAVIGEPIPAGMRLHHAPRMRDRSPVPIGADR